MGGGGRGGVPWGPRCALCDAAATYTGFVKEDVAAAAAEGGGGG